MFAGDFIEETTTSIAGTLGDGAVTLTALQSVAPGTVRFSNVLGTSTARLVRYVIEDITATAGKFEKGIGSVNNNVLTRTSVRATWNGATYKTTGASALQFGASPTSGNIRVRCSAYASSILPSVPFVVTSLGADIGILPPWSSERPAPTGTSYVLNKQYFFPYFYQGDGPISQVACIVGSGTGGAHIQFALYEIGSDGLPGRALLIFNSMSAATNAVNVKDSTTGTWGGDLSANLWLPPGWYWLSWEVDNVSPTFQSIWNHDLTGFCGGPMQMYDISSSGYWGSQLLSDGSATFGVFPNPRTAGLSIDSAGSGSVGPPLFGIKPSN